MSDVTTIVSSSKDGEMFSDKSIEELEQLLDNLPDPRFTKAGHMEAPEAPTEAPPEAPPEPAPVEAASPEPPKEPEPDPAELLRAHEAEQDRIQLQKLMAHNSRLAGELGYVKQQLSQLRSSPRPSEPYQPDTDAEADRLSRLERTVQEAEAARRQAEVQAAINEVFAAAQIPDFETLKPHIEAVAPTYRQQLDEAKACGDPAVARQIAEASLRSVIADAKELAWQVRHKELLERKAATVADMEKAKKSATISASGAVPAAPPKPKTYADMSPEELDKLLRDLTR